MMMIKNKMLIALLLISLPSLMAIGQSRYIDRAGKASFYSEAPLENIEAHTDQALSILDVQKAEIAVSLLMKSFQFEKALMQEHFNEKYVESDKYPKATFKGKLIGLDKIDLTKDGTYTVDVEGDLTIHGETTPVKTTAQLVVKNKALSANSTFRVKVKDFKIEIPSIVVKNIAEEVEVKVSFNYQPA